MDVTVTAGNSDVVVWECISVQIPSASATPWPSNTKTRPILSGSGGDPMITAQAAPSAIAIEYLCLTSAASSANDHSIGPVTYADGATGLRKAARFSKGRAPLSISGIRGAIQRIGTKHRTAVDAPDHTCTLTAMGVVMAVATAESAKAAIHCSQLG
jgi:hypothetical protein